MQKESSIRYILASQSPRRRELLEKLSIPFEVIPAKGKEFSDKKDPGDYAADLAFHKAYEVLERTRK
jgi:septum formation protein